MTKLIQTVEK